MCKILSRRGDAFAARVLSTDEYVTYQNASNKAQYLSKCWAVKEAVVKAYGTGFRDPFIPHNISYTSNGDRPYVSFAEEIRDSGILNDTTIHLSVSDELHQVIAFVIVEKK